MSDYGEQYAERMRQPIELSEADQERVAALLQPKVGTIRMKVFRGGLSGRYFAALMRWNGNQWEAEGGKHDVTEDVQYLIEDERKHGE